MTCIAEKPQNIRVLQSSRSFKNSQDVRSNISKWKQSATGISEVKLINSFCKRLNFSAKAMGAGRIICAQKNSNLKAN